MTHDEKRLLRHLVLAVMAHMTALTALWWWLIVFYTSRACRVMRGRVTVAHIRVNGPNAC
jgi:hypothetical protein